uniref:Reverse transcriptase Ty1/copia-type domain-containing protein n=1 Tax=Cajanus cajan TaxID=3821 RepID=A0A151T4Z2_CAJCA|nr:hypothetical protein KK1_016654 [Cajanus cajan]
MFVKHSVEGKVALFIVYVNDIVITGNDYDQIKHLKGILAKKFEVKDLGQLKYFLGMKIARTKNGIYVSGCKAANTPIEPEKRSEEDSPSTNKDRYQSLVGKLIYLTHTRPDIGFAVSLGSRYTSNPTKAHMKTANKILQYLKGTPGRGLYFKKNSNKSIEVYTDSDWAGCPSFVVGLSINWMLKMPFFMGICLRKFTWSNLLGLLLRGSLSVWYVVSANHFMVLSSLQGHGLVDLVP